MDDEFEPNESEVFESGDREWVKIAFRRDDGESREIVMRKAMIPTLVAQLVDRIEQGQVVPIGREALQIGRSFRTSGWTVKRLPNGSVRLTLHVTFEDEGRTVTIPLELSKKEIESIIQQIS